MFEADPLGSGTGPVAIDREVVNSDMTDCRMGISGFGHTDWIIPHH